MGNYRELIASIIALAGAVALAWVALGLIIRLLLGPIATLLAWLAVLVQP